MKLIHFLEPKGGAVGKEYFFLAVYTIMGLGEADVKKQSELYRGSQGWTSHGQRPLRLAWMCVRPGSSDSVDLGGEQKVSKDLPGVG